MDFKTWLAGGLMTSAVPSSSSSQLTIVLFICSGRQLPSARQQGVFAYPKQSYGLSRNCFEMTCQATMPSVEGVLLSCSSVCHQLDS
jgi:hypothetical protein